MEDLLNRIHVEKENGQKLAYIRDTGIRASAILKLINDGVEQGVILQQYQNLNEDDLKACIQFGNVANFY